MLVEFWIEDQKFTALNGRPAVQIQQPFTESELRDPAEIDRYWEKLLPGR
jgi:predicted 3-demethylubiquinone-9 3-methyltransferase (glyoxalase superfamily)